MVWASKYFVYYLYLGILSMAAIKSYFYLVWVEGIHYNFKSYVYLSRILIDDFDFPMFFSGLNFMKLDIFVWIREFKFDASIACTTPTVGSKPY